MFDWKDEGIDLDPVSHVLTFYEGFLGLVMDLDPNVYSGDGLLIPPFVISNAIKIACQQVSFLFFEILMIRLHKKK